ncbi:hypothetical protein M8818_000231 [Zalaria obscura]|uniref:Uncharacterized protein n=1 Tax=Zalaria obscura TaxID=2024903 RepID=A0ACC3SP10_9PEZI
MSSKGLPPRSAPMQRSATELDSQSDAATGFRTNIYSLGLTLFTPIQHVWTFSVSLSFCLVGLSLKLILVLVFPDLSRVNPSEPGILAPICVPNHLLPVTLILFSEISNHPYPPQQESTYPPAIRYANRIPQQMSDPLYPEFANSDPTWPQSIPSTIPTQPYWLSPSLGPGFSDSNPVSFPTYSDTIVAAPETCTSGFLDPDPMLSPHLARRASRATSFASNASSTFSHSHSDASGEATSPSAHEMSKWGIRNANGSWSCAFPGCASRSLFHRGCDLRKHYKRHTKSLFCRHKGCLQATEGGFSSKKDRARHEAKHDPKIGCEWEGCGRIFSRMDNMKGPQKEFW